MEYTHPHQTKHNPELMLTASQLIDGKEYYEVYKVNQWLRVRLYVHGESKIILGCSGDDYRILFYLEINPNILANTNGIEI